jgi:hypothetical protein
MTTYQHNDGGRRLKLDEITLGKTYRGTMAETVLAKRAGGYYTGYTRKATGRICDVEFRVDQVQYQTLWGSWVEVCGKRRSVTNCFSVQKLGEVELATG